MTSIQLANRTKRVKPSATLSVTARAKALAAEGRDIIVLGAGEPDFDTPQHIKDAAITALNDGFTKYTAVDGTAGLKAAIVNKFKNDNNLAFSTDQILVSCGGKQSFYNLAQALLNPGDEVIIPAPYWVSYPDMVLLADAEPVILETHMEDNFLLSPEKLEAAITDKTRLIVLNSPSNPTGRVYSHDNLRAIGKVLKKYPDIIIATDDMYEHILWTEESFENILTLCPELYDQTIVLNGVSKAYSMTGWRIGYAAGPAKLIGAMKKIQSQSTSGPNSIAQVAAQAALEGSQDCVADMLKAFKQRHTLVYKGLSKIEGVQCLESQGTFYSFPSFKGVIERLDGIDDDIALAEFFIEKAGVAMVPGSAFGAPGHMRISFATDNKTLEDALTRIADAIGA